MMQSAVEVFGCWPKLINESVEALVLQEFWYKGTLEDDAMVCWLKVSQQWYRIYFDLGSAYCVESDTPPTVDLSVDDQCDCQFNDVSNIIGLKSTLVRHACLEERLNSLGFIMEFTNGVRFELSHNRSRTEYSIQLTH